jgi:CRP-like cAMP-binding protein
MSVLTLDQLVTFSPFNQMPEAQAKTLLSRAEVIFYEAGGTILRKNQQCDYLLYLLRGNIEVRSSFFERFNIAHDDKRASQPLQDMAGADAQITARTKCRIMRLKASEFESLDAHSTPPEYELDTTSDDQLDSAYMVEDANLDADWMSGFLHSPLVNHVSARDIQLLLAEIEDINYSAGTTVVRAGEYGDYFYVVKKGLAVVKTDPRGPYKGKEFSLMPGSYFGEEALVGNTIRNAEIYMETAGVLGRVDQATFNQLIRDSLVVKTRADKLAGILNEPSDHNIILDVRLYPEYRRGHRQNSQNIPLVALRERLDQLDIAKHYYITPEGGPRSELATFLMRQAGFNAVLLQDSEPQPGDQQAGA